MFERFTDRARAVLVLAQEEARLLNHSWLGTEHILLGLIHEGDGLGAKALVSLGVSLEAVRDKVAEAVGPGTSGPTGSPPFTPRAKKVLELSLREALQLGHNYIGTEHILLGLLREGEGVAAQVLVSLGLNLSTVRQQVIRLLEGYQGTETSELILHAYAKRPGLEVGESVRHAGNDWRIEVVRAGRREADCIAAYGVLANLADGAGISLDTVPQGAITVSSVETTEGPGLQIRAVYLEDDAASAGGV